MIPGEIGNTMGDCLECPENLPLSVVTAAQVALCLRMIETETGGHKSPSESILKYITCFYVIIIMETPTYTGGELSVVIPVPAP